MKSFTELCEDIDEACGSNHKTKKEESCDCEDKDDCQCDDADLEEAAGDISVDVEFVRSTKEKMVTDAVKKYKVKLTAINGKGDDNLKISGNKKNISNFLVSQGWNKSDLKKWYPEL